MDILGKHFWDPARVKIMRLFLLNPLTPFDIVEVSEKSKTKREIARKEAVLLELVGLTKKKTFFKEISVKKQSKKIKKQRVSGWVLDESFPLLFPLKNVLMSGNPLNRREELVNRFKNCGRSEEHTSELQSRLHLLCRL